MQCESIELNKDNIINIEEFNISVFWLFWQKAVALQISLCEYMIKTIYMYPKGCRLCVCNDW